MSGLKVWGGRGLCFLYVDSVVISKYSLLIYTWRINIR